LWVSHLLLLLLLLQLLFRLSHEAQLQKSV
jgi:hypothetical protein